MSHMHLQDVVKQEKSEEAQILDNVTRWQSSNDPLAPLTEEQLDLIYRVRDCIRKEYFEPTTDVKTHKEQEELEPEPDIIINSYGKFMKWLVKVEESVSNENLKSYQAHFENLEEQTTGCERLYNLADDTLESLNKLKEKYTLVAAKTGSLHNLSDHLMKQQMLLREKKNLVSERLQHFTSFDPSQEFLEKNSHKINSPEYAKTLEKVSDSIVYLGEHINYKEARTYKIKYEILLNNTLNRIYRYFNNVISETIRHIIDPDSKAELISLNPNDTNIDTAFALYYGKFQSAALKVKLIISHLEDKESNEQYNNILFDCHKTYFSQRLPILQTAVSKALQDLREKHKRDYSVLFRSCCLFIMKICQDEARCFYYFFSKQLDQLDDYLGTLCQQLYDTLRPSLITINHVEILCELCGILRKELLSEKVLSNQQLSKYVDAVNQLLQDVEERLVFRTNVFFQHDLNGYQPSPGDLAYPEKLEQMENIAVELREVRTGSRASITSADSQEVSHISATPLTQFRSYTGNSPADLHGMWYPTVKRTLVCLSRLYFCLDQETFQGLAQEALATCVRTIDKAAGMISSRKSVIDGKLFQIKHLLIIREQIAPFQVDFTVREVSLDFSGMQKAAVDLIHRRDKLFTFSSSNALLEFLLEGTPKVKEYLIDSRKEIDKNLKYSCEQFISFATQMLIGGILKWMQEVEQYSKKPRLNDQGKIITIRQLEIGKPEFIANLIADCLKKIRSKVPSIQRSMQLYLSNRETEFILFRPIKNNVVNAFIQIENSFNIAKFSEEDRLLLACPSGEQVNVLICSVSLLMDQDVSSRSSHVS